MQRNLVPTLAAMGFFLIAPGMARADELTVETAPPVVVKTVPEAGLSDVDPGTKEILVTFSRPMLDRNWSWVTLSKDSFPETTGKPHYLPDQKTCALPVKLERGKTYALWLNSQKFHNFKTADGTTAVPYLLVFRTRS